MTPLWPPFNLRFAVMNFPVAIITGAGGGIGRASAIELSTRGYQVILAGRTAETLDQTAAMIGHASVITADVTSPADIQKLVDQTIAKLGRIDLVVNNAGIAPMLSVEEMSIEQYHAVMDTNLSAAFYLSKAVWPSFRKQGGGAIVNVSSLAARDPFPGFSIYGAAKAGLNLFGLSLAREGATIGVRVYTVAPGAVETPLLRSLLTPEQFPTERTMDPADVAKVIAQCATGDLRFSSGEVIWLHK
jgi:NAD(P)-dependent dehydrogenase (short-subunit alcohol dehydrogenase family)